MMKTGMLWFDNKGSLEERVKRAADYYQRKYGVRPNVCFTTRTECTTEAVDGISIRPDGHILDNHYWLGFEESKNAI